jgi:hypothetical protein
VADYWVTTLPTQPPPRLRTKGLHNLIDPGNIDSIIDDFHSSGNEPRANVEGISHPLGDTDDRVSQRKRQLVEEARFQRVYRLDGVLSADDDGHPGHPSDHPAQESAVGGVGVQDGNIPLTQEAVQR